MTVRFLIGDALAMLKTLPSDSVHCCVTSPPYWGLRDYGTGEWEGGEPGCDHSTIRRGHGEHEKQATSAGTSPDRIEGGNCRKCGARRIDNQIGLEPTPEAWAARLVEVFREVRRVLRPDGVCFVNVGDSYCANVGAGFQPTRGRQRGTLGAKNPFEHPTKPKDLIGQPWLLAFALRADGWWLRSEIIWAKPNPMPESVSDRPTKSHEQVFLLTKASSYFWDQEAVRQAHKSESLARYEYGLKATAAIKGSLADRRQAGIGNSERMREFMNLAGRNVRSVWTIATEPYSEAHFATFPTELARRCILAGTSAKGVCPACGAPWARVVERETDAPSYRPTNSPIRYLAVSAAGNGRNGASDSTLGMVQRTDTIGWRPTCFCPPAEPVSTTVLDPFGGAGTTSLVAEQLGRDSIYIDLSPAYADMARARIERAKARRFIGDADRVKPLTGQIALFD